MNEATLTGGPRLAPDHAGKPMEYLDAKQKRRRRRGLNPRQLDYSIRFRLLLAVTPDITASSSTTSVTGTLTPSAYWQSTSRSGGEEVPEMSLSWAFYEPGQILYDYGDRTGYNTILVSYWNSRNYVGVLHGTWETYGSHNLWYYDLFGQYQHQGISTHNSAAW